MSVVLCRVLILHLTILNNNFPLFYTIHKLQNVLEHIRALIRKNDSREVLYSILCTTLVCYNRQVRKTNQIPNTLIKIKFS